jgi:uncharacterized Zn finger protein
MIWSDLERSHLPNRHRLDIRLEAPNACGLDPFKVNQPPVPYRPIPTVKPPLLHPRKVRGGVKLSGGQVEGPTLWAAQRWLRVLEEAGAGGAMVEGLEYARQGQTKRMGASPGKIEASIQGRSDRPYATSITLGTFSEEAWERVAKAMSEGAIYAAKLLASELPSNIEDLFGPLDLRLFPTSTADVTVSCNCTEAKAAEAEGKPLWCKHVCCLAYLFSQRLANEPFLIFMLRGLEGKELLERLRERRIAAGAAAAGSATLYQQHVPGVADILSVPLEEAGPGFWDAGPGLSQIEIPLDAPKVTHPLLRRLGPSPFTGTAQFPLVGMLASCYDTISRDAMNPIEDEIGARDAAHDEGESAAADDEAGNA